MFRLSRFLFVLCLPLLLGGCAARFTNLTPAQQPRTPEGMYHVEFALQSQQQTLRWETITPFALVGEKYYPLTKVELVPNRWEGYVPVPAGTNLLHYRFKVDYEVNDFGKRTPGSAISTTYSVRIKE